MRQNNTSTTRASVDRRRLSLPLLLSVLFLAVMVLICCALLFLRFRQTSDPAAVPSDSLTEVPLPASAPPVDSEGSASGGDSDQNGSAATLITDTESASAGSDDALLSASDAAESAPAPDPAPSYPDKPDVDIHSWEFMLANSFNGIGEYEPPVLLYQGQSIDERIADAAEAFLTAAHNAGFEAYYSVLFRNYEYQTSYFESAFSRAGEDAVKAVELFLPPGFSDHQTGLCVDFTDSAYYNARYDEFDDSYMRDTDLYRWLTEHCAEYGFVLRYPEGKEAFYGTPCSHPAHFRYVGKEAAAFMTEHDLCLEEFIMLYDDRLVYVPNP